MGVDRGNTDSWAFEPGLPGASAEPAPADVKKWADLEATYAAADAGWAGIPYTPPAAQADPVPSATASSNLVPDQVSDLQLKLNHLNFAAGTVDGDYGPVTTAAVSAFQAEHGLPTTGIADTATLNRLSAEFDRPAIVSSALESGMSGFFGPTRTTVDEAEDQLYDTIVPERVNTTERIASIASDSIVGLPSAALEAERLAALERETRQRTINPDTDRPYTEVEQNQALVNSLMRRVTDAEDALTGAIVPERDATKRFVEGVAASDGLQALPSIDVELERLAAFEADVRKNTINHVTGQAYTETEQDQAIIASLTRTQGNLRNTIDGWQTGNGLSIMAEPQYVLAQADEVDEQLLELHAPVTRPIVAQIEASQNDSGAPTARAITDALRELTSPESPHSEGEIWAVLKELDNRGLLDDALTEIANNPLSTRLGPTQLAYGEVGDTTSEFLWQLSFDLDIAGDSRLTRAIAADLASDERFYVPLGQAVAKGEGLELANEMLTVLGTRHEPDHIESLSLQLAVGLEAYTENTRSVVEDFTATEIELAYLMSQTGTWTQDNAARATAIEEFREIDHADTYAAFETHSAQTIAYLNDLANLRANPLLSDYRSDELIAAEAELFRDVTYFLRDPHSLATLEDVVINAGNGETTLLSSLNDTRLQESLGDDFGAIEDALTESAVNIAVSAVAEGRVDDAERVLDTMAADNSFLAADSKTALGLLKRVISSESIATQLVDADFDNTVQPLSPNTAAVIRTGTVMLGAYSVYSTASAVDFENGTVSDEIAALNSAVGWSSGTLKELGEWAGEEMIRYHMQGAHGITADNRIFIVGADGVVDTARAPNWTTRVARTGVAAPLSQYTWDQAELIATRRLGGMTLADATDDIADGANFVRINRISGATGGVTVLFDSAKVIENLTGEDPDGWQALIDGSNATAGLITSAGAFVSIPTPLTVGAGIVLVVNGVAQYQYNKAVESNVHENEATQRFIENLLGDGLDPAQREIAADQLLNSDSDGRMVGYVLQAAAMRRGVPTHELVESIAQLEQSQIKLLVEAAHGINYDQDSILRADDSNDDTDVAIAMNQAHGTHQNDEYVGQFVDLAPSTPVLLDGEGDFLVNADGIVTSAPEDVTTRGVYDLAHTPFDPADLFRRPDDAAIITPQSIEGWINYAEALGIDLPSG